LDLRPGRGVGGFFCRKNRAHSEIPAPGPTVQRRLFRAKARLSPTALIKKERQRTSCPLLPICLKPISSVQPNASCDHSVKQERTIATRIGLGHNTFPAPPRESNNYFAEDEVITGTIDSEETRSPRWRLSIQTLARTHNLESVIHAVERLTSERRDKSESLIPIRFINTHKVHIANRFAD
jgi:hypothetical protein